MTVDTLQPPVVATLGSIETLRSLLRLRYQPLDVLSELADRRHPLLRGRLGPRDVWFVFESALAHSILQRPMEVLRRPWPIRALVERSGGRGLFTTYDQDWQRRRQLVERRLRASAMAGKVASVQQIVDDELDRAPLGVAFDVEPLLHRVTLRTAVLVVFGADLLDGPGADSVAAAYRRLVSWQLGRLRSPLLVMPGLPVPRDRRMVTDRAAIHRMIERSLTHPDVTEDSIAAALRDQVARGELTQADALSEIFGLLFAAHDTSTGALTWCLVELCKDPAHVAAVAEQITATLGRSDPGYEDLRRLRLLDELVEEVLLRYPPAYMIVRSVRQPFDAHGVSFRSGDLVLVAAWSMRHHGSGQGRGVPFGAGPNRCPGSAAANMELRLVIASIVRRFTVEACGDVAIEPRFSLRSASSLPVRLDPRP